MSSGKLLSGVLVVLALFVGGYWTSGWKAEAEASAGLCRDLTERGEVAEPVQLPRAAGREAPRAPMPALEGASPMSRREALHANSPAAGGASPGLVVVEERPSEESAVLRIQAGRAALQVHVYEQGAVNPVHAGKTDAQGELVLEWRRKQPIRIDLLDEYDAVLGSTDVYQAYPQGVESLVPIGLATGALVVALPAGVQVLPDQALQYLLELDGSPAPHPRVETVVGAHPELALRGIKTSAVGIEYRTLRPGTYRIQAISLIKRENGRWYPSGARWVGAALVRPGLESRCELR